MPNIFLSRFLSPDQITVPLRARTFKDAVAEMVNKLIEGGAIRDVPALEHALSAARGRDVVAIGRDVALPHFRTDSVDRMLVSLGIASAPLDPGDSGLEIPPRIIALVLAPPEAATLYLQTVAALARFLEAGDVVRRLYEAKSAAEVASMPEFGTLKIQPQLAVRDLMTHGATTISPKAKARDAVDVMVRKRLRALPVVGEKNEVLGIVTEWDIMRALLPHIPRAGEETMLDQESEELAVRDVMSRSVLCVSEDMGLEEAANIMINKRVEQCPVVREGVFTGMLTRSDIIRKLFAR